MQVDVLGPHVQNGHYDLTGPNGEIILPSVWEKVIEPDWQITMTMWPIEKSPPIRGAPPPGMVRPGGPNMPPPPGIRQGAGIPIPPGGPFRPGAGMGPGMVPPPGWNGKDRPPPAVPAGVTVVDAPKKKKKKEPTPTLASWFVGKPVKKK